MTKNEQALRVVGKYLLSLHYRLKIGLGKNNEVVKGLKIHGDLCVASLPMEAGFSNKEMKEIKG